MRVRAKGLLEMQLRHEDLRIFADGEMDSWVGRERSAAHGLGNAFLLQWLDAQKKSGTRGNWLKQNR